MLPCSTALSDALDAGTVPEERKILSIAPVVGSPLYLTDHVNDIGYGSVTYQRSGGTIPGFVLKSCRRAAGTAMSDLTFELHAGDAAEINGKRLPLAALDGDLRGAWVRVERCYPSEPSLGILHLFEGTISEAKPTATVVEVTVEGLMAQLESVKLPRTVFAPGCTNALFDAQCGLSKAAYTVSGHVTAGATTTSFNSDRTESGGGGLPILSPYFTNGVVTFTSGANTGESRGVRAFSQPNGHFVLDAPLPYAPAVNDTFTAVPGCNKSRVTCHFTFGNAIRFRGFPFIPREITR